MSRNYSDWEYEVWMEVGKEYKRCPDNIFRRVSYCHAPCTEIRKCHCRLFVCMRWNSLAHIICSQTTFATEILHLETRLTFSPKFHQMNNSSFFHNPSSQIFSLLSIEYFFTDSSETCLYMSFHFAVFKW